MHSIITMLLAVVLGASCPLVPRPQSTALRDGQVYILQNDVIISHDCKSEQQAELLQSELYRYLDITTVLSPVSRGIKKIDKGIILSENPSYLPEQYSINMSSEAVRIVASSKSGFVNGVMAFVQLSRLSRTQDGIVRIQCYEINDRPRYEWRGFMLDEARHFFGKDMVKQVIDWMALYRMNRFHWHLADTQAWRLEIKGYPLLAKVGGMGNHGDPFAPAKYYTQEDIREIVSYAEKRNIEIIPEIDMPGHATAAVRAYPEFDGGGSAKVPSYTFNPGKEGTYKFLNRILAEVDALFPSQIVHIGGDEVSYANEDWKTDKDVQELMARESLDSLKAVENYFCRRMADSLYVRNNNVAAWDEVAGANLDKDKTILYFWRPNRTDMLQKALDAGYRIVCSPRLPMYFDYAQDTLQVHGVPWKRFGTNTYTAIYNYEPLSYDVKYPQKPNIIGVQANMWTERVFTPERLEYMMFPRIAALAETCWTDPENKDIDNFNERLKNQFVLYREDLIYFCNPFDRGETGEPMR